MTPIPQIPCRPLRRPAVAGRTRRAGFTLTELMLALGVLGIGLTMAAAAFQAGIKNHDTTVDEILRTMMSENALAIARVRLHYGDLPAGISIPSSIGPKDRMYPVGRPETGRGYVLFVNQLVPNKNDYEFTVMPYRTADANRRVDAEYVGKFTLATVTDDLLGQVSAISGDSTEGIDMKFPVGGVVLVHLDGGGFADAKVAKHFGTAGTSGGSTGGRGGRGGGGGTVGTMQAFLTKFFDPTKYPRKPAMTSTILKDGSGAMVTGEFDILESFSTRAGLSPSGS